MVPMFGTHSVTFWYPRPLPVPYYSTTSQPLYTPIPNPKREGGKEAGERARALPRPSRLTRDDLACPSHVLSTDRQTPPAGGVIVRSQWVKQWKHSAQTCPHMSKVAHEGVHVSQTSAEMRLFSENLHVVTSRS